MRKLQKKIVPVFCALLVVCVAFCGLLLFSDLFTPENAEAEAGTSYSSGSTGQAVKQIQKALKNKGYYTGSVDGIFGRQTTAAVKKFQKAVGLKVDGIVGPATLKKLGVSVGTDGKTDVRLLARLIYGEARGEAYMGQVAVGAVVLNRVASPLFPNTVSGVIYQAGAFDAVRDGQIDMSPNDTALRAANDAMNGWDPTGGCLYYYNPKTATSRWMLSKTVHLTIGNHAFCL